MPNSGCVEAAASIALSTPLGEEQARTTTGSVLSVWWPEREWSAAGRFASQLALIAVEKLSSVELLEDLWRTAPNHSRPASCIVDADIDAEDYPERDPQKGH